MDSLFKQRPKRRAQLILMVAGSLVFHGALVGVAAIWPQEQSYDLKPPEIEMDLAEQLGDPEVRELVVAENAPTPEPDQPTPPPEDTPAPEDTPPPDNQEINVDDTPPPPKPSPKPAVKKTGTPAPANAKRGPVGIEGVVGGNPGGTKATGTPGGLKVGAVGMRTPKPPYPYQARAARLTGTCIVRVTTDASGSVSSVVVTKSSGSGILDSSATGFIKGNWKASPNSTFSKPIDYVLK